MQQFERVKTEMKLMQHFCQYAANSEGKISQMLRIFGEYVLHATQCFVRELGVEILEILSKNSNPTCDYG